MVTLQPPPLIVYPIMLTLLWGWGGGAGVGLQPQCFWLLVLDRTATYDHYAL